MDMEQKKLAQIINAQKSLTEWLEDINHRDTETIRKDDGDKRERLKVLNEIIDLPFDRPIQFECRELTEDNPVFASFLNEKGSELCALRLIPKKSGLSKMRMRGLTIRNAYKWFLEQNIDVEDYRADFMRHFSSPIWGTIFIVNEHGIQGEITRGGHHQLTQGFHEEGTPVVFRYDFTDWHLLPRDDAALSYLSELIKFLHVPDKNLQKELKKRVGATFSHDYIEGYFETSESEEGAWFIDYNAHLGDMYKDAIFRTEVSPEEAILKGQTGCNGIAKGKVFIIDDTKSTVEFPEGAVLVCALTTPDFVPYMQKACAIVTDQGGILSHAAIVARELKKPCIVGTEKATSILKDGEVVMVNADQGLVQPL